jgi:hypothetical protein
MPAPPVVVTVPPVATATVPVPVVTMRMPSVVPLSVSCDTSSSTATLPPALSTRMPASVVLVIVKIWPCGKILRLAPFALVRLMPPVVT